MSVPAYLKQDVDDLSSRFAAVKNPDELAALAEEQTALVSRIAAARAEALQQVAESFLSLTNQLEQAHMKAVQALMQVDLPADATNGTSTNGGTNNNAGPTAM